MNSRFTKYLVVGATICLSPSAILVGNQILADDAVKVTSKEVWAQPKSVTTVKKQTQADEVPRVAGLFDSEQLLAPTQRGERPQTALGIEGPREMPAINGVLNVNNSSPALSDPIPLNSPALQAPKSVTIQDSKIVPIQNLDSGSTPPAFPAPAIPALTSDQGLFPADDTPRTTPPAASIFPADAPAATPADRQPQTLPDLNSDLPNIDQLQQTPTPQLEQPKPFNIGSQPEVQQTTNFQPPQIPANTFPAPTAAPSQNNYNPPASGAQLAGNEEIHEVQPGENYWTISRQHFGTARYFAALAEYNRHRIPRPDRMRPGMFVLVPDAKVLEQRYPKMAGIVDALPKPESLLQPGFFITRDGQPMYRIGKGDTITDIAEKHLGRTARWTQIAGMNRDILKDGHTLKIGTVLRLPHDASQVALAPAGQSIR